MIDTHLLRRVADKLRHPLKGEVYNQAEWGFQSDCGTTACIAGWTCVVAGDILNQCSLSTARRAATLLGINNPFCDLFDGDPVAVWPEPYAERWAFASTEPEQREIAADLLEAIADGTVRIRDNGRFEYSNT